MKDLMKRRLFGVGAILVAGAALAFVSFGNLGNNLVYYWSPSELVEKGAQAQGVTVRLGGMVVAGSYDPSKCQPGCDFNVTDGKAEVEVASTGTPPQMFREGMGCVVEGEFGSDAKFHTDRIMVKHSNEYRPPKAGERPEDMYKSLVDDDAAGAK